MPTERDPRSQRALRLASGTALCLATSFGLDLPIPFLAPVLALLLLALSNRPLPLKAGPVLVLMVLLTSSVGLLLIPLLRHTALSGFLLVGLGMFLCFRYEQLGGNALLSTLLVIGLTLVSASGTASFKLALLVVEALTKGMLLAVLFVMLGHWLFPEPIDTPTDPPRPALAPAEAAWVALRATLVVLPTFLMVLIDPTSYIPLVIKSVSLGQQVSSTNARDAGRELLGSTLLGGLLAILFWGGLGLFPHLWMFFLWMLLFCLWLARKLYGLDPSRRSTGFWLSTLSTLIILLGQSVQDSIAGKDVYSAFAVRMGLFIAVTLYACGVVYVIDNQRVRRQRRTIRASEAP
jgi:Protein of unknown function (DUF2955)